MRYFTQALAEEDPGRKDMLLDIATEELSHLEVIGSIIAMLNRGAKGMLAETVDQQAEMYRALQGAGNDSHVTQILYGGGPALVNSAGQLWNAGYIDTIGEPTADLRSNIAAEARAKIVYERLINVTEDPGVRDALTFLMTREVAHQKSFEKALYSMDKSFPPGKLPGDPRFTDVYVNTSRGEGDTTGPWCEGKGFSKVITPTEDSLPVDGGDGHCEVGLTPEEQTAVDAFILRGKSDPTRDPVTGADLGTLQQEATR
jgi:Mn-containing catalase